jgi:protein TonB
MTLSAQAKYFGPALAGSLVLHALVLAFLMRGLKPQGHLASAPAREVVVRLLPPPQLVPPVPIVPPKPRPWPLPPKPIAKPAPVSKEADGRPLARQEGNVVMKGDPQVNPQSAASVALKGDPPVNLQSAASVGPKADPLPAAPPPVSAPRFDAAYLDNPKPAYPLMARKNGDQGKVLLRVHVTAEGRADEVHVQTPSGVASLDNAARAAVQTWRFVPARQGTQPVPAWVLVPVVFKLEE